MFNIIWPMVLIVSMAVAIFNGKIDVVSAGVLINTTFAIKIVMDLLGILAFWLGLMRIAKKVGLMDALVGYLRPLLAIFFQTPPEHHFFGLIVMSVVSNILALSNVVTSVSVRAIQAMKAIHKYPVVASNTMIDIVHPNGLDSSVALMATTIMAAVETTLYLGTVGITRARHAVLSSLIGRYAV